MSSCPTAPSALEHDTARRLKPLDALDGARSLRAPLHAPLRSSLRDRAVLIAAAAAADNAPDHGPSGPSMTATRADAGRDPARESLERTCLTVKRIAHDIGMPRATLEAYRLGTRRMPPAARARLGAYLAAHAAMLDELAQALLSHTAIIPPNTLGALEAPLDAPLNAD